MSEEEPGGAIWPTGRQTDATWLMRLFASSRYFVFVAVVGSFLSAVTLYAYGALVVISIIVETIREFRVSIEGRSTFRCRLSN